MCESDHLQLWLRLSRPASVEEKLVPNTLITHSASDMGFLPCNSAFSFLKQVDDN